MKSSMAKALAIAVLVVACLPMAACAPRVGSFVRDDVDFSYIQRVVVFPFNNITQDVYAGQKLHSIFMTEILAHDAIGVVETGEVISAMTRLRIAADAVLTPEQVIKLGEELTADAVFFCTVEEYGVERTNRDLTQVVTASYRLVEAQTGQTVWRAQVRTDGSSVWRKLFGGGTASLYDVSRRNVTSVLETLF